MIKKGEVIAKVPEDQLLDALKTELDKIAKKEKFF